MPLFVARSVVRISKGKEIGLLHRSSDASEFSTKNSSGRDGHSLSDSNEEKKCDTLIQKQAQS